MRLEVEVRLAVLKCFCKTDDEFLYHLAQKEMLDMLFMTLYDENYQMQEAAVGLLGRLSDINPAFVFPRLRRIVLENISQLVNSRTPRFEEHSAKIIARLAIQVSICMQGTNMRILHFAVSVLREPVHELGPIRPDSAPPRGQEERGCNRACAERVE